MQKYGHGKMQRQLGPFSWTNMPMGPNGCPSWACTWLITDDVQGAGRIMGPHGAPDLIDRLRLATQLEPMVMVR